MFGFVFFVFKSLLGIDQFRYIKIQPQTIDLSTKLCGVNTELYMLFAGWEGRIVKNCDRGLENAALSSIFKSEVTVFHYTDRP